MLFVSLITQLAALNWLVHMAVVPTFVNGEPNTPASRSATLIVIIFVVIGIIGTIREIF